MKLLFYSLWHELWKYRQLIRQLAVRDLKARYKISVLGFFWSLLRPLLTVLVLAGVFTIILPFASSNYTVPFAVLLLTSYFPWFFFSAAWLEGTQSLLANAQLIKKVYSPRAVFPTAVVSANLFNFFLSGLVLLPVLYLIFSPKPTGAIFMLPLVILTHTAFLLGLCFFTSVLNVLYRDTMQIVEFWVFVWFYVSPVLYDVDQVMRRGSHLLSRLYFLNPMAGIIEWYRYTLLASHFQYPLEYSTFLFCIVLPYTIIFSLALLLLGYVFFKKYETRAVDEL